MMLCIVLAATAVGYSSAILALLLGASWITAALLLMGLGPAAGLVPIGIVLLSHNIAEPPPEEDDGRLRRAA